MLMSLCSWKDCMEQRISKLEQALISGTSPGSQPILPNTSANASKTSDQVAVSQGSNLLHRPHEAVLNVCCGPGAFPSSSLNIFVVNDQDVSYLIGPNLVARGLVSQHALEKHLKFYLSYLNPYIYHPLKYNDTVTKLLARSSLLLTAICAVAAFCAGSDDRQSCQEIFVNEVSAKTFSHTHTYDVVRGLCIGAFWLGKESSALSALGEVNTQIQLPSWVHHRTNIE